MKGSPCLLCALLTIVRHPFCSGLIMLGKLNILHYQLKIKNQKTYLLNDRIQNFSPNMGDLAFDMVPAFPSFTPKQLI